MTTLDHGRQLEPPRRGGRRGLGRLAFTLVELLVVVAIIALLVTILMPSLQRAMKLARRAACATNVRSVCLSAHLYAADFDDRLPGGGTGGASNGPDIKYNQGNVKYFIEKYLGWEKATGKCPGSKLDQYAKDLSWGEYIDYWLAGFGASSYQSHWVYDHPRLEAVAEEGPNGPKVLVMDWAFTYPMTDAVRMYEYEYATGHEPGNPEGGNVAGADGSVRWIPIERWWGGEEGYRNDLGSMLSDGVSIPMGWYTQRWGHGSIDTWQEPGRLTVLEPIHPNESPLGLPFRYFGGSDFKAQRELYGYE